MKYIYVNLIGDNAFNQKGEVVTFRDIRQSNTVFCYGKNTILHFCRSLLKANFACVENGRLCEEQFRLFRNGSGSPISILFKVNGKLVNFFDFTQFLREESNFLNDIVRFEHIMDFFRSNFNVDIASNARSLPNLSRRFLESYMEKQGEKIVRNHERYDYLNSYNLIRGGACLIPYPKNVGEIIEHVNAYDRKSAYPYEFLRSPHVVNECNYEEKEGIHFEREKISLVALTGLTGYSKRGCLWNDPLTGEPSDFIYDCNVIFPQREFEIMDALYELEYEKSVTIQFPKNYLMSFHLFANDFYEYKEQSAGDIRYCMKMIINSATGALCSRNNPISYINAGLVYGNARAKLLETISTVKDCYYTDTDSIFTTERIATGGMIGDFEQRAENAKLCVLGKKVYAIADESDKITDIHVAGVSKKLLDFSNIQEFATNPELEYAVETEKENYKVEKEIIKRRLTDIL